MRAEDAIQLYRDSGYNDLITFEEDLARIASIVVVIAESSGSYAELGAFASNDTIRKILRIVIPKELETSETFIRYGPIKRVLNEKEAFIGSFPWRTRNDKLIVATARPHYSSIKKWMRDHISSTPASFTFDDGDKASLFYTIYWVVHLCLAITPVTLQRYVQSLVPQATVEEIRNKLFCMRLSKWIGRESYCGQEFYFACFDNEPFQYAFKIGVTEKDRSRRNLEISSAHLAKEKVPSYIRKVARQARSVVV